MLLEEINQVIGGFYYQYGVRIYDMNKKMHNAFPVIGLGAVFTVSQYFKEAHAKFSGALA
jgi:hypothetical protein